MHAEHSLFSNPTPWEKARHDSAAKVVAAAAVHFGEMDCDSVSERTMLGRMMSGG